MHPRGVLRPLPLRHTTILITTHGGQSSEVTMAVGAGADWQFSAVRSRNKVKRRRKRGGRGGGEEGEEGEEERGEGRPGQEIQLPNCC